MKYNRLKRRPLLHYLLFLGLLLLQIVPIHAQVNPEYQDCTQGAHPIFSAWRLPDTVCAGEVVPFRIGYDTSNTIVLTSSEPHVDSAKRMFIPDGVPCGDENSCVYSSPITFHGYTGVITSANDIKYVRLNIEHTRAGELYIGLKCPTGQRAAIMNVGTDFSGATDCASNISWITTGWSVNGSKNTDFWNCT